MQGEVFEIHLAHEGAERSVEPPDDTGGGVKCDPEEIEPLAGGMVITLIARDAINILNNYCIEVAALGSAHHRKEAGAIDCGCARSGAIFKGGDNGEAFAGRDVAAKCNLIVNRAL